MNERIEKLIEQAIIQNEPDWIDIRKALTGSGSLYLHVFAEKFAQLIVQECLKQITDRTVDESELLYEHEETTECVNEALMDAHHNIAIHFGFAEHFGVEE